MRSHLLLSLPLLSVLGPSVASAQSAPSPAPLPPAPAALSTTPADASAKAAETSAKPAESDAALQVGSAGGARAAGLAIPGVSGNGFMDTRLTWTFGDDDFLHGTGELYPLSPKASVGDRSQYRLFFDNLNSRFAGRENLTHLVMYKRMPSYFPNITTEAAVVLRFDLASLAAGSGNLNGALYDSGSYLRIFRRTGGTDAKPSGTSLVFFPLDTDRVRLGYLYDTSWGGTAASINQSIFPRVQGSSPGLKIQHEGEGYYGYFAFKSAQIVQPQIVLNPGGTGDVEVVRVGEANYGFLGGAGYDFSDSLRMDAGAGYFMQGRFDLEGVRGKPVYTYGGSSRLIFHKQMPVPQSIDFQLYRNDPMAPMTFFAPEKYNENEFAYSIAAEGNALMQHLKDYENYGETKDQLAAAGSLQAVLKAGYLRASATGIARDLNYVVRNVPGFIPFNTTPKSATTQSEAFGAVALDYHLPDLKLTPGISAGAQLPATFKSEFSEGGVPSQKTIVVRQQGDQSILPLGAGRRLIVQLRANLKLQLSDMMAINAWVQYVRDDNGTLVIRDPLDGSGSIRVFQSPDRLGAGVAVQARF
jgi:hypothetical protein